MVKITYRSEDGYHTILAEDDIVIQGGSGTKLYGISHATHSGNIEYFNDADLISITTQKKIDYSKLKPLDDLES